MREVTKWIYTLQMPRPGEFPIVGFSHVRAGTGVYCTSSFESVRWSACKGRLIRLHPTESGAGPILGSYNSPFPDLFWPLSADVAYVLALT